MTKLYMVWDRISDSYFSEVAGVTRQEPWGTAYVYDKKHAIRILHDVNTVITAILKAKDIPDEAKMPVDLSLKEVSVDDVPISEEILDRAWTSKVKNGFPVAKALRLCKYEQVRRYNDYIDFNYRKSPSHKYRYMTETF